MRVALDTNILVYAEDVDDAHRGQLARDLLLASGNDQIVIPLQALGELFTVLTRKARWTAKAAKLAVLAWHDGYEVVPALSQAFLDATDLAERHRLAFWDALMLSVAAEAGCQRLLSEDMQDGFSWRGVTIRNPFRMTPPAG